MKKTISKEVEPYSLLDTYLYVDKDYETWAGYVRYILQPAVSMKYLRQHVNYYDGPFNFMKNPKFRKFLKFFKKNYAATYQDLCFMYYKTHHIADYVDEQLLAVDY